MENRNQELTEKLNHLIAIAEDGKTGYENAARDVKEEEMKVLFMKFSNERMSYIIQLQEQILLAGGKPENKGSQPGAMHRAWMNVKSAFTSGNKNAIINTCISGEEAAVNEYQEALNADYIIGNVRTLLSTQLQGIQNALKMIRQNYTATS